MAWCQTCHAGLPYLVRVIGARHKEEKPREWIFSRAWELPALEPCPAKGKREARTYEALKGGKEGSGKINTYHSERLQQSL